jgi:hypothetical protein
MKCKTVSLSIAVLFCLAVMPFFLSYAAYGEGCGTNPLGDTSGDTDFYVSKNQNSGGSGALSAEQSAPAKAAVTLGSVAKADKNATILSINPDRPSPQGSGTTIVWKAEASNPNNEKMLYDFLLTGPSTGGQLMDETGWIAESSWAWNTTDANEGENQIVVRTMRAGSAGFEDSKMQSYIISKTSGTISEKPRIAPDERSFVAAPTSGPNMQMPDTKPKPLTQAAAQVQVATQTAVGTMVAEPVQVAAVSDEPIIMEAEGKWTVKLENEGATLNPLTLIQTGESVMGMGTLNEKNIKLQVSAKGFVSKNTLSLDAWTIMSKFGNKIDKHINLDLVKTGEVVSGSYEMYSGEDLIGKGNATASRFAS